MRVPIQLAFSFPERLQSDFDRLDWFTMHDLTFERPDTERFRCLALAYEALNRGGNAPCIVNAANEIVNRAFLEGRCRFLAMADIIEQTLQQATFIKTPSYEDYLQSDAEARRIAVSHIKP